jgi:hypothetical protein
LVRRCVPRAVQSGTHGAPGGQEGRPCTQPCGPVRNPRRRPQEWRPCTQPSTQRHVRSTAEACS